MISELIGIACEWMTPWHSLGLLLLQIFYVYTKNESFQSFGTIEDYAVYRVSEDNAQW